VTLAAGAALGRVRIERKKDGPADAMATIKRVGFDVGEPGPMPRAHATAAMAFVKDGRHARLAESACGDVAAPELLEAGLAEPAGVRGPGARPGFPGQPPSGVGVPLSGPAAGPGPPATTPPGPPTTTPPGPPAATPPPGPPPTIAPQPPGSPVTIASPAP
jgi:hypothetical protein